MNMIERELFENKDKMNKKQILSLERVLAKLNNSLGGIRKMSSLPDVIFVTDTKKEKVAIAEANKLNIPVIALLDSNSNPNGIDYPIPCNDDNQRAVALISQLIADAVLVGMEVSFEKRESLMKQRRDDKNNSQVKRKSFARASNKKNNDSTDFFDANDLVDSDASSTEDKKVSDDLSNLSNNSQESKNTDIQNKDQNNNKSSIITNLKSKKSFLGNSSSVSQKPNSHSRQVSSGAGGFSSAAANLIRKTNNSNNSSSQGQVKNKDQNKDSANLANNNKSVQRKPFVKKNETENKNIETQ